MMSIIYTTGAVVWLLVCAASLGLTLYAIGGSINRWAKRRVEREARAALERHEGEAWIDDPVALYRYRRQR